MRKLKTVTVGSVTPFYYATTDWLLSHPTSLMNNYKPLLRFHYPSLLPTSSKGTKPQCREFLAQLVDNSHRTA
jgi:hypothetical protein